MQKTDNVDEIWERLKKCDPRLWIIMISTFIFGLAAHGMVFLNKYCVHDDVSMFNHLGGTFSSGRWLLGLFEIHFYDWFQSNQYTTPWSHGLLCLIYIAIAIYLYVDILQINSKGLCILLSGIVVSFPMFAALYGYMFDAPYYMLAFFLSVVGGYIICKYEKNIWALIAGMLILACSMGLYQSYIPNTLSLFSLYFIRYIKKDWVDLKSAVKKGAYLCMSMVGSFVIYMLLQKMFYHIYSVGLTDNQGISSWGYEGMVAYVYRIIYAIEYFFNPKDVLGSASPFQFRGMLLYRIIVALVSGLCVFKIVVYCKSKKWRISRVICYCLSVCTFPLCAEFIFVMCNPQIVHILMTFGMIMPFFGLALVMEDFLYTDLLTDGVGRWLKNSLYAFSAVVLALMLVANIRYDNISYLKAELDQSRAISYFTTLITKIKSTSGYKDEYPVAYINAGSISDESLHNIQCFEEIRIQPWVGTVDTVNDYVWWEYMELWCGYGPAQADASAFIENPIVQNMPSYPDDGSIMVIDNVIVVKF